MTWQGDPVIKLSIIIANYNFRDFVGAAIESALAVDWPNKEVIVVDDASTDDSKTIIEGFRASVTAFFRPKSHQLGSHMFGFEQSTGEIIIFLDSDDLLEPEVMQEITKVWRSGVSKVQFRMNLIDATGAQLGTAIPQFPPKGDPDKLRRNFLRTMAYTTPQGTGNAYSRDFVQQAYSMATGTMRWSDTVLLTLAPILGDVLTIGRPLARCRIHTANNTGLRSLDPAKIRERLEEDIDKAALFLSVSRQLRLPVPRDPLRYSLNHLQYRLVSYLLKSSAHSFPEDTLSTLVYRLILSAIRSSQMPFRDRAILIVWAIVCALAPQYLRRKLVLWRFVATSRPPMIGTLLGALSSLHSPRLPDHT
jgi:glycosyltransferase involved in cell wall biosynthesis